MYTPEQLLAMVDARIARLDLDRQPRHLYEPISYTLDAGGKRMRPVFVLLGCHLFSDDVAPALDVAAAVEVFHNFTLLHDDIMDRADKRRGRDTVHVRWSENTAILSGDAMVIYAYSLLTGGGGPHLERLLGIFNKFALEVCEGQQYDMDFETASGVTEADYLRMIELKTSVLLAGALEMGGVVGGADGRACRLLYETGRHLGLAFQLQDDLLDTYGDPATFGKNIGGDIVSNKKTFLLIDALNRAAAADRAELERLLSDPAVERREKIEGVKAVYDRLGTRELTQRRIDACFDRALEILRDVDVPASRKIPLEDMARWLMRREK